MALSISHLRSNPGSSVTSLHRLISSALQTYRDVSLRQNNLITVNSRLEPVNLKIEQRRDVDLRQDSTAYWSVAGDGHKDSRYLLGLQGPFEYAPAAEPLPHGFSSWVEMIDGREQKVFGTGNFGTSIQAGGTAPAYTASDSARILKLGSVPPSSSPDSERLHTEAGPVPYKYTLTSPFTVGLGVSAVFGLGAVAGCLHVPLLSLVARSGPHLAVLAGHATSVASLGLGIVGSLYANATKAVLLNPIASCFFSVLSGAALAWIARIRSQPIYPYSADSLSQTDSSAGCSDFFLDTRKDHSTSPPTPTALPPPSSRRPDTMSAWGRLHPAHPDMCDPMNRPLIHTEESPSYIQKWRFETRQAHRAMPSTYSGLPRRTRRSASDPGDMSAFRLRAIMMGNYTRAEPMDRLKYAKSGFALRGGTILSGSWWLGV